MRALFLLSSLLSLTQISYGQDSTVSRVNSFFDDTTLTQTILVDKFNLNDKIVVFNFNKEAVIYVTENSLRQAAARYINDDYEYLRNNSREIISLLNKENASDTIFLKDYSQQLKCLISDQLKKGNARIFDKKSNAFVQSIYHRLERVISTADRVFYFKNNNRFYQVREWSGITPNELMPDIE